MHKGPCALYDVQTNYTVKKWNAFNICVPFKPNIFNVRKNSDQRESTAPDFHILVVSPWISFSLFFPKCHRSTGLSLVECPQMRVSPLAPGANILSSHHSWKQEGRANVLIVSINSYAYMFLNKSLCH